MFFILLESLYIFGDLDSNTEILIYTSTKFMNIIKQSHLYNKNIKFEINDDYDNLDKACKSRLDLFNLSSIQNYEKIIYLDTDILIKGNINNIFDICKEDILYALEEGTIDSKLDYWGTSLFKDEANNYEDKTAFCSGILLFKNCSKIKELFEIIKISIKSNEHFFHDQPYFVYNAFKYNLYNNKLLKHYCVNNNFNSNSNFIIHHFPGGPGIHMKKIPVMNEFLIELKNNIIDINIENTKNFINENLLPIIHNTKENLEGNIFMLHNTTKYTNVYEKKKKNISNLVLNKNITNVMEIGFNAGFSTLLMLISNPNLKITCFDLGLHKYTKPCYDKIKETFGDRINLILGDSKKTLPTINNHFELIHIDGGHSTDVAESDIINSYRLSKQGTILIMDDYDFSNLRILWDKYIDQYDLKLVNVSIFDTKQQDIKYVNKNSIKYQLEDYNLKGCYCKYKKDARIFWSNSSEDIKPDIFFTSEEHYHKHRENNGYPKNWQFIKTI
jgi:predicted O-methyltransferase YrrM